MANTSATDRALPVNIAATDVLREGAVAEYEQGMGRFYNQLVRLNLNIEIMERVFDFPADLFDVGQGAGASFLAITRNSSRLNYPEQHPEWWPSMREAMSPEEVEQLNKYRRKFGMAEL